MSCKWFDKYDQGKIKEELFQAHAKECLSCQEKTQQDEELLLLFRSLKKKVDAPFLWTRIEHDLREAQMKSKKERWRGNFLFSWKKIPVTIGLIIAVCGGLYLWLRPGLHASTLLADSSLRRIERREQRYERSIEKLQIRIFPHVADLGMELKLLYRDRMETIDEQILACKEALRENPGNTHIRKYMLAAFQDKKLTLQEMMETSRDIFEE